MSTANTPRCAAAVPEIIESTEIVRWVPYLLYDNGNRRLLLREFETADYSAAITAARHAADDDPRVCGYAVLRRSSRHRSPDTDPHGHREDSR